MENTAYASSFVFFEVVLSGLSETLTLTAVSLRMMLWTKRISRVVGAVAACYGPAAGDVAHW